MQRPTYRLRLGKWFRFCRTETNRKNSVQFYEQKLNGFKINELIGFCSTRQKLKKATGSIWFNYNMFNWKYISHKEKFQLSTCLSQIPKFQFATHRLTSLLSSLSHASLCCLSASHFSLSTWHRTSAHPLSVSSSWACLFPTQHLSSLGAQCLAQPLPSSTVTPSLAPYTRSSLVLQHTSVIFFFEFMPWFVCLYKVCILFSFY